jgi:hypothetical protein
MQLAMIAVAIQRVLEAIVVPSPYVALSCQE